MSALPAFDTTEGMPSPPPSLWRNHDYMLLWCGQAISLMGSQMSALAFPLLVLSITRSPGQTGIAAALRGIPFIILVLPAGALIDRWDRKRTMILCDSGRALTFATIPIAMAFGHLSLVQLYVATFVEGALFVFYNVSESACLPRVVSKEQLPAAVAQNSTLDSTSLMLGPSLGGALYGLGRSLPFVFDAVSYTISVASLFFMRTDFQEERTPNDTHLLEEISIGLSWLWRHTVVRYVAFLTGGLSVFSMGYPLILIVLAQHLHATPFQVGIMFATGGIGSIAGAVVTPYLQRRFTLGWMIVGGTWVWVLTWPPLAFAHSLIWLGIVNALAWFIVPVYMSTQFSLRLVVTPDELQGRVNSVYKLIAFGGEPLSLALTGVSIELFGAVNTIFIITAPQVVMAVVTTLYARIRRLPRLAEITANVEVARG